MGFSRQENWSRLPFPFQWTIFCQNSSTWPVHCGWPYMAWFSFIELDKSVVHVIRFGLVFCDCGFSLSAPWCPLSVPTILLVGSNYHTVALISHASKAMLKILQARLQQYVNCELPDVQAGFRKSRGTRDQLPTSTGSSKKTREF